jgi:hypothetical protein
VTDVIWTERFEPNADAVAQGLRAWETFLAQATRRACSGPISLGESSDPGIAAGTRES